MSSIIRLTPNHPPQVLECYRQMSQAFKDDPGWEWDQANKIFWDRRWDAVWHELRKPTYTTLFNQPFSEIFRLTWRLAINPPRTLAPPELRKMRRVIKREIEAHYALGDAETARQCEELLRVAQLAEMLTWDNRRRHNIEAFGADCERACQAILVLALLRIYAKQCTRIAALLTAIALGLRTVRSGRSARTALERISQPLAK
jgi:hypothetical protein